MSFEITQWADRRLLWLDSSKIEEGMELYSREKIEGIGLSPHKGFKLHHLDFLNDYPNVIGIALPYAEDIDIGGLSALRHLKFLSLTGNRQKFDISIFKAIEELSVEWHPKLLLPAQCPSLQKLLLKKYKARDLKNLPVCPNLVRIELVQGSATTLDGLQSFPRLRFAEFSFMRDLNDISAVVKARHLEELRFDTCKNVEDFTLLGGALQLMNLRIINCGEIPSIAFLNKIVTLKEFRFVKTKIIDGDLLPLMRLEKVGFLPSRHYSHTPEQIEAVIHERLVEEINGPGSKKNSK